MFPVFGWNQWLCPFFFVPFNLRSSSRISPQRLLDHMGKTSRVDRAIIEIGHSQGAAPTGLFGVALRAYHLRVHAYFL
jgi:hypothetical protein